MSHQGKIQVALDLANETHRNEWRKGSGLPYMTHIYDVMRLASKIGIPIEDWGTYCTIALHDTYESGMALANIELYMGETIRKYVELLSYIPERDIPVQLNKTRKQAYLDSFGNPDLPIQVLMVKALDRLCNVVDFRESGDVNYARKYLMMADVLFDTVLATRRTDVVTHYGLITFKCLEKEYYRVRDLTRCDPTF
jgi:(p)ppGpp synthase/HD superfamily hydrolase